MIFREPSVLPSSIFTPELKHLLQVADALVHRDNILTEQQMMEDKIKATDWEATNEAIEEQVTTWTWTFV